MADTAKNSFIVVLPNQIITIPQDSNLAWLPLFYALPKELVSKRKQYLDIPRNPYDVLRTDKNADQQRQAKQICFRELQNVPIAAVKCITAQ